MAAGKTDEALIEAQLATKLDPLSLKEKFHLAELYYRSGRYVEAISLFDEILAKDPYFKEAGILKAWGHLFLGEHDTAARIFHSIPLTRDTRIGQVTITHYFFLPLMRRKKCSDNLRSAWKRRSRH